MTIEEFLDNVRAIMGNADLPDDFVIEMDDLINEFAPEPLEPTEFRFSTILDISDTRYDLNVPDAAERIQRIKNMMQDSQMVKDELNSEADIMADRLFDERESGPDDDLEDTDDVD